MGSAYQFHSWRVFVLVCAFPSVFAIGALTTQPESPRFFLEVTWLGLGWGQGTAGGFCVPSSQGPYSVGLYLHSFVWNVSLEGFCGWGRQGTCSTTGGLKFYRQGRWP